MAGVAELFHFHQRGLDDQVAVRENAGEVDQLIEQAQHAFDLGAAPAAEDRASPGIQPDESLLQDERLDDEHAVLLEQPADFGADRRQRAVLNLNELFAADGIDAKSLQPLLGPRLFAGVHRFELAVERGFHALGVSREW